MSLIQKLTPLFILIALIGLGAAGFFAYKYQKSQKELQTIKTDPTSIQQAAQDQAKQLVAQVGKLIELPQGEDPTVATITDVDKLKDQPFFQNAKNGDKVLIYTNAKKAILYDPDANKIIDVAPVNIGSSSAQTQASSSGTLAQTKVVLRNGTTTTGLTNKIESQLKTSNPEVQVVTKENASNSNYDKTLVVVINTSSQTEANTLAKALSAQVSNLPAGETKPTNADILIIIGKDKT